VLCAGFEYKIRLDFLSSASSLVMPSAQRRRPAASSVRSHTTELPKKTRQAIQTGMVSATACVLVVCGHEDVSPPPFCRSGQNWHRIK
jgi:hypothetical protein